ncbi:anti-sigma factor family protein [Actinomadura chibensis]|uniref:Zf-HC2 domain-containing protein n=1 Tax=Actinomadura chibensis TaxID=392828 RepID=A0A5D0NRF4_9ACTN|nr:zf-HC2 domain-containing protein [Actinomadura chibensis]TYB46681.1 zf-HC2 domain-containing protein [Actinomadura chibensis]
MSCLGERLTALVDGELGHEERDRALAHLACCDRCREEVASLRRLKGRLRGLSETPATDGADDLPSPDFLLRLRSLPASGASGPSGGVPSEQAPTVPAAARHSARPLRSSTRPARPPSGGRPRDNRPGGHAAALRVHPRRRYLVMGAATLFIGLGAASYAAGGGQDAPAVTPAFDRFAVEHALTSGDAPMTDPLTDPVNQVQVSPGP